MKIVLPIYYDFTFRTKKPKRILVGLNWYRNAHHRVSNNVKIHYHKLTAAAVKDNKFGRIKLVYKVYAGRNGTDGHNIRAVIEKFFMDGLVECGAIVDDDISHVIGDTSEYYIDKDNPRIEIEIIEA
jgi:hypothetical protein